MLKTTQLQAIASVKRMGDLQALSVNPSCLEFGPNDSKIVLKPRHGYILKVLSTPFRAQVITLSALPPSAQDQGLNLLCPVRALRIYIERSALGSRNNSFMLWPPHQGVSGHKAETIQMDSDAITLAYSSLTSPRPGRGLAVCPLQKYVWRPAGPRHSHLPGFIIWKFWPYRPRSFLHNMLTLVI